MEIRVDPTAQWAFCLTHHKLGLLILEEKALCKTLLAAMAVQWCVTLTLAELLWLDLRRWVADCLAIADEIASNLRSGNFGLFRGH
ncbi:hypothetical protein SAY87_027314 [Trapa incisa]|uniref:Uncharacterized protein n=1 Tax=Trapa incisa TaxID=236973 RepID=A0AAN7H0P3_9MYRT|nr:hypothetical protein SAY87_027314 [Trapa incisa]